jgi:GDP-mannose transporter
LKDANVETVIVFRACAPLAVSGFDYIFHRRALPSIRSSLAMLIIVGGAAGYVNSDKSFQVSKGTRGLPVWGEGESSSIVGLWT